ncbi:MAG: DUF692 domain-containing protein [Caldilineaceae bacterium]|nr:DUF692 domain-containing protein [Caldilineaceae bacterium]
MLENIPFLGVGLGYRQEMAEGILSSAERIDFLELVIDQYLDMPPYKEKEARLLAERFPVILHGIELSVGTDSPISEEYLDKVHQVASWTNPKFVSEHIAYTQVPGLNIGQLTPLSFNEATVAATVHNIRHVASTFTCPFAVENISYYFLVPPTTMTEAEFISRVVDESGCWLLLDLTNVQNNAVNNQLDHLDFLDHIPLDHVIQIHLAGGDTFEGILLDTHSHPVPPDVFDMLQYVAPQMPNLKCVMIERDQEYPPMSELLAELDHVREILLRDWAPYHASQSASELLLSGSLK